MYLNLIKRNNLSVNIRFKYIFSNQSQSEVRNKQRSSTVSRLWDDITLIPTKTYHLKNYRNREVFNLILRKKKLPVQKCNYNDVQFDKSHTLQTLSNITFRNLILLFSFTPRSHVTCHINIDLYYDSQLYDQKEILTWLTKLQNDTTTFKGLPWIFYKSVGWKTTAQRRMKITLGVCTAKATVALNIIQGPAILI